MATAILTVVLTFALTGLLGNWLLQQWQQRNWLNQQRFLGEQKNYENLKELCEEIVHVSNNRLWKMRRLLSAIRSSVADTIDLRINEYDKALGEWNESLPRFLVKLRFYAAYDLAIRMEDPLQRVFVAMGANLERLARVKLTGGTIPQDNLDIVSMGLNDLGGLVIAINRDLWNCLTIQKTKTYYGKRIQLSEDTLEKFPLWELVKGLFQPRIKPLSIVRPPTDLTPPLGGWF
jgi:hypothetical protein